LVDHGYRAQFFSLASHKKVRGILMTSKALIQCLIVAIISSTLLITGQFASAQVLEEIIVTAQKREQDISDVGISITAFSGEQLQQLGMTNTRDIDMHTPGLMVTDYGSGTTTAFTIRGSSQLDFADHQEPPVAVYLDGAYNSYLGGVGFNFFDLERIEVLRGPQGTLFGRNATGGLVHVISARPTQEKEGHFELTAGEFGQIRAEGVFSGPLSDTTSGRLSLAYEKTDGYQENSIGDDLNDVNNFSGRAQLLFEPSDEVSIHLSGRYSTDDTNGQGYHIRSGLADIGGIPGLPGDGLVHEGTVAQQDAFCAGWFGPPFPLVSGATDCFGFSEPDSDPHTVSLNELGFFKRDHVGMTATIEWQLTDSTSLVSITDWQDFEKEYLEDTDSSPADLFTFPQSADSNQLSQEIQLHTETENAQWVTGFYYLNIDSDYRSGTNTFNCCLTTLDNSWQMETESYAFFVQADLNLSDTWSVVTGVRWTEDEKDIMATPACIDAGPGADFGLPDDPCPFFFGGSAQVGPPLISNRDEGEWSGVVELDWRPNEDWLVYAKYSRGNKAGGYNAGAAMIFDAATAFEYGGEILTSIEGGFKATLFDGKARLNVSIFNYDYEDFQSFSQQGPNLIVFNTDAENTGGEIELFANPAEGWEFLLGLSIQDAMQKDVAFGPVTRDRPMPNSPDLSVNGLGRYEWSAFNGTMAAQVDFNYVDERSLNGIDHPGLLVDSYTIANARLGYVTDDGTWDASIWVKNFTDEDYVSTAFDISIFTGAIIDAPGAPRWVGATLRYNF
jgi:iron complex outermembrane receptor protein